MLNEFSRTRRVIGQESMDRLAASRVAVFGVGGVGGYVVEALARSGVGTLDLIDSDEVALTNINRQIIALHSTIGRPKVEVFTARIADISPETVVNTYQTFYLPEKAEEFDLSQYDYIVDAIDTVTAKLDLIVRATEGGIPIISCMGCGNRFDPTALVVTDIYKTSMDPLAKVMRTELRKRGVPALKVVYSTEPPIRPLPDPDVESESETRRSIPGSTAFVPSAAGLIAASVVVRDLTGFDPGSRIKGGKQ